MKLLTMNFILCLEDGNGAMATEASEHVMILPHMFEQLVVSRKLCLTEFNGAAVSMGTTVKSLNMTSELGCGIEARARITVTVRA